MNIYICINNKTIVLTLPEITVKSYFIKTLTQPKRH